jgi:hypothetical protein
MRVTHAQSGARRSSSLKLSLAMNFFMAAYFLLLVSEMRLDQPIARTDSSLEAFRLPIQNVAPSPSLNASTPQSNIQSRHLLKDWGVLKNRLSIVENIQKSGRKRGIEIGVQKGRLAMRNLEIWKDCEEYKLYVLE